MDRAKPTPSKRTKAEPAAALPVEVFAHHTPGTRLDTERLTIRPATPADAVAFEAAIHALIASGDGASGVNLPGEQARTIVKRQLDLTATGLRTGGALRRTIFDRKDQGNVLGACNLITIERGLEWYAELAFWLTPGARGRGIAREASIAVIEHALDDLPRGLGVASVRGYVQPGNVRARTLLAGLGFTHVPEASEHKDTGGQQRPHDLWLRTVAG